MIASAQLGRPPRTPSQLRLISNEIESKGALEAGELAFCARLWALVGQPLTDPMKRLDLTLEERLRWERKNGAVRLKMLGDPDYGVPWGNPARDLAIFLVTEAVRTREPLIYMGRSCGEMVCKVEGGRVTGGVNGSLTRYANQYFRFLTTTFSATLDVLDDGKRYWCDHRFVVADKTEICWDARRPDQNGLWNSSVLLSPNFFRMAIDRPVPVDLRAYRALSGPLARDLYVWVAHRTAYLQGEVTISWPELEGQFGANFSSIHEFRRKILSRLRSVMEVFPGARIGVKPGTKEVPGGLILRPVRRPVVGFRISTGGC